MKDFQNKNFKGVFPADHISDIPVSKTDKQISFISNTSKDSEKGEHWQAVLITKDPPTIEFFDSYGDDPSPLVSREIRELVRRYMPGSTSQMKINRVQLQSNKSSSCGAQCMVFLKDRLVNGKTFQEATKFDVVKKVAQGEKRANKLLEEIEEFGKVRV
eukprot:Lithocolla_globosa_v1_NODE_1327_length_2668_cov_25.370073.p2 type:complete len:159 gc:universal NODE_1327_length_2668_cov_25.370073:1435-1911(+)